MQEGDTYRDGHGHRIEIEETYGDDGSSQARYRVVESETENRDVGDVAQTSQKIINEMYEEAA